MGVTGLLPLLKKASSNCNVRRFSGCTVAIDAYGWLHKGAFGCAVQLGKGEPTTAYINYCVKYLNLLLSHNVRPIMVLDGRNLPSKAVTEVKRREKRAENRKNAKEFLRKGMKKEAWECFTRCIDITPAMARAFIKVLRDMKIDYVVAPYEADAQLAYMARNNIVDIVITEDSDLILFGCPKIFYKMSMTGDGVLFDATKIPICLGLKPEQFDFDRFRFMCILSGCDYLPSLPGIGLVRAKKLIDATTGRDIRKMLKAIPKVLKIDVEVTEEYIQGFIDAELTFLYQLCFDTLKKRLVPLTPYPADKNRDDLLFAGSYVDNKLARDMALGNVDLHTLEKVDNFDPNKSHTGYNHSKSIWSPLYTVPTEVKVVTARDMKSKTKHTSTVGMQANITAGPSFKKKHETEMKSDSSNSNDADEDELISMYSRSQTSSICDVDDASDSEIMKIETEKSSKRKRVFLSQLSSQEEISEEDGDENKEQEQPLKRRSTRSNPFLKVEKKSPTKIEHKDFQHLSSPNPICLIERNKIYENGPDVKVIVKSHYFRDLDKASNSREAPTKKSSKGENLVNHEMTDEPDETDCVLKNNGFKAAEMDKDSQVTIYSLHDDSEDNDSIADDNSPLTANSASSIITLNDDEDDEDPIPANVRTRLRNSFLKSSPPKKVISPRKASRPAGRVGMSKTALMKIKPADSKQQTLSAMFGLKARPKM